MNTASLELCKELYELSGWLFASPAEIYDYPHWEDAKRGIFVAPKYDLGYLLRKLPSNIHIYCTNKGEGRITGHDNPPNFITTIKGDTPEDAACKLSIELFKQGVLSKEAV